uniref:Uncharacterized protein n=1 Tax=Gossypium raimondii TaxID=29730 RepID=A0A0D2R7S5_GOSRA|nr:hypothetical protein B456_002G172800 [Gossypium raimondii]
MSILGTKASCISFKDSTCRCFGYMVSKKKYIYTIDDDCFALPNRREALIISSWPQTSLPRSTDLVKIFENFQALEEKEVLALLSKLDLDNIHFNDEVVLGFSSLLANINFNLLILAACYLIRLLVMLA